MKKLINEIERIEFKTGENFSYDLEKEFDLISSDLNQEEQTFLKEDFDQFLLKGKFLVLNTFAGGILFLKEPEQIEKIKIASLHEHKKIKASVVFVSGSRRPENIKSKPEAGKTESIDWDLRLIFPNFHRYTNTIKHALLIVIGKIVKRICEYGRTNFAYLKIENDFNIELILDDQIKSKLRVKIENSREVAEPIGDKLQCPCCDYFTLEKRGEYDICHVCFWEDDGVDIDNIDIHSGPNHLTLRQGRQNFLKFGACDSSMVKNVLGESDKKKFKLEKRTIE